MHISPLAFCVYPITWLPSRFDCHIALSLHIAYLCSLITLLHSYCILHISPLAFCAYPIIVRFILFSHSPNLPWWEAKARTPPSSHCGPTSGPFSVLRGRVIYPFSAPRPRGRRRNGPLALIRRARPPSLLQARGPPHGGELPGRGGFVISVTSPATHPLSRSSPGLRERLGALLKGTKGGHLGRGPLELDVRLRLVPRKYPRAFLKAGSHPKGRFSATSTRRRTEAAATPWLATARSSPARQALQNRC